MIQNVDGATAWGMHVWSGWAPSHNAAGGDTTGHAPVRDGG